MRLLIIDDHLSFRKQLVEEFKQQPDMQVVGEVDCLHHALETLYQLKPDIILIDEELPDTSGLEAARAILSGYPDIQIVILTKHDGDRDLLEAVRIGVKGYLLKNILPVKIVAAVRGMLRGEAPLSREMTARLIAQLARNEGGLEHREQHLMGLLTARETEVLAEVSGGLSNQEIAEKLFVSENTVRNHMHSILEKLSLRSRREAGAVGRRYGLKPKEN